MKLKLNKFIGDSTFYKMVLAIAVPMMIQNGITNLVNMLDNIMVGSLSTEAMSGVSIVNQFIFIFNLLIFGAVSAVGIFTAQYFGSGDNEGVKYTFRFKLYINIACAMLGIIAFIIFDDSLINLFLHEGDSSGDLAATLNFGKQYLYVILIGLIPYSITQAYASTLREGGETVMPMIASLSAVFTNFILNIILIFGYLGAPALGVTGAAIATTVSRFAELFILVVFAHRRTEKFVFLRDVFRSFFIPLTLSRKIAAKLPIMLNEFLWAVAMMLRNQSYSLRGLDVVAAQNISSTLFNVFNVVYYALGSSIAIIVGSQLGAGKFDKARDTARKMLSFSVAASVLLGILFALCSGFFPQLYNTENTVRGLAGYMMIILAISMPFCAFANSAYFTLRSGGLVFITILFDSVYMWCIVVPTCLILAYLTSANIYVLFAVTQLTEVLKVIFGLVLLLRGKWVRRLVGDENKSADGSKATDKSPDSSSIA